MKLWTLDVQHDCEEGGSALRLYDPAGMLVALKESSWEEWQTFGAGRVTIELRDTDGDHNGDYIGRHRKSDTVPV